MSQSSRMAPLRVLIVASDPEVKRPIEHVVSEEGDIIASASSIEEAVTAASIDKVDLAFIELRVEGGAALALCHHIPSLCPGAALHAIVHGNELDRGTEALSLGAATVIVAPPTGEAIARALNDVKLETMRRREITSLENKLARERKRLETYDRLVRFARGAAPSDAVRAIVDGVSQLTSAQGVALYATFGDDDSERVLLAALGTALDLPSTCAPADLSRLVSARSARVVPLIASSGSLGMLVLDRAPAMIEPDIAQLADLAAAMLSIVDRQDGVDEGVRLFPPKHFRSVADRLLTLAQRHDRRASVLAISLPGDRSAKREEAVREIVDIIRTTDALCGLEDGDLLLFLPETTGLGAQVCRRRILARLQGDRRARSKGESRRSDSNRVQLSVALGVATFPHDGTTLRRLVKTARARAADDARSSVHVLGLEGMPLSDVIDSLLSRPMVDAGPRSSYPLNVASTALFSLAARACKEATRGGEALVTTTLQPGLGVAAAARQVAIPRVHDVRGEPGCSDVEAIVIEAEHGSWVCAGRIVGERFQGVHAADPLLADIIEKRLVAAGANHAG
jgi:DNA-binding NarL/FixJ family response regulator